MKNFSLLCLKTVHKYVSVKQSNTIFNSPCVVQWNTPLSNFTQNVIIKMTTASHISTVPKTSSIYFDNNISPVLHRVIQQNTVTFK